MRRKRTRDIAHKSNLKRGWAIQKSERGALFPERAEKKRIISPDSWSVVSCSMNTLLLYKAGLTRLIYAWGSVRKTKGQSQIKLFLPTRTGRCQIQSYFVFNSWLASSTYVCSMYKLDGKAIMGMSKVMMELMRWQNIWVH